MVFQMVNARSRRLFINIRGVASHDVSYIMFKNWILASTVWSHVPIDTLVESKRWVIGLSRADRVNNSRHSRRYAPPVPGVGRAGPGVACRRGSTDELNQSAQLLLNNYISSLERECYETELLHVFKCSGNLLFLYWILRISNKQYIYELLYNFSYTKSVQSYARFWPFF